MRPTGALQLLGFLLFLVALFFFYLDWQRYAVFGAFLGLWGSLCVRKVSDRELLREFLRRMSKQSELPEAILDIVNLSSRDELREKWQRDANLYKGLIIALIGLLIVVLLLSLLLGRAI